MNQHILRKQSFSFLVAVVCLCGGGGYNAQAQMIINVYPSQDHTNRTIWIFSGSSTASANNSIRTSSGNDYEGRDTWEPQENNGNFYNANKPTPTNFQLFPLLSSTNTIDIASVRARIPGGGRTNITFAANATNTPTITIASINRTISHLFMDDNNTVEDTIGIRVSGSALSYSTGNSSAWVGSGIINKPIGDFFAGRTFNNDGSSNPWFAAASNGSVRVIVNNQIIPEPEEYALIFGLFALGFVFFHRRHRQKKQRRQAAAS